ncbi:unnamed protein product, partial [Closterium sp. Naga37s-1]
MAVHCNLHDFACGAAIASPPALRIVPHHQSTHLASIELTFESTQKSSPALRISELGVAPIIRAVVGGGTEGFKWHGELDLTSIRPMVDDGGTEGFKGHARVLILFSSTPPAPPPSPPPPPEYSPEGELDFESIRPCLRRLKEYSPSRRAGLDLHPPHGGRRNGGLQGACLSALSSYAVSPPPSTPLYLHPSPPPECSPEGELDGGTEGFKGHARGELGLT